MANSDMEDPEVEFAGLEEGQDALIEGMVKHPGNKNIQRAPRMPRLKLGNIIHDANQRLLAIGQGLQLQVNLHMGFEEILQNGSSEKPILLPRGKHPGEPAHRDVNSWLVDGAPMLHFPAVFCEDLHRKVHEMLDVFVIFKVTFVWPKEREEED